MKRSEIWWVDFNPDGRISGQKYDLPEDAKRYNFKLSKAFKVAWKVTFPDQVMAIVSNDLRLTYPLAQHFAQSVHDGKVRVIHIDLTKY